jgi:hypothetical protein
VVMTCARSRRLSHTRVRGLRNSPRYHDHRHHYGTHIASPGVDGVVCSSPTESSRVEVPHFDWRQRSAHSVLVHSDTN